MNENLILLEYIYKNAEMGSYTIKKTIKELENKENKIKKILSDELIEFDKYIKKTHDIIKKHKLDVKETSITDKLGAGMGIKMEIGNDNSDTSIAKMLIEGMTMGITDIEPKIKDYKDVVKKDTLNLAKEYLKYQQNEIEKLKEFL